MALGLSDFGAVEQGKAEFADLCESEDVDDGAPMVVKHAVFIRMQVENEQRVGR